MDVAFLDKHGRVKFRPLDKKIASPDGVNKAVTPPQRGNTSRGGENINTSSSKHQRLAPRASAKTPSLSRRHSAIPIAQFQSTEACRAILEASPPTHFTVQQSPTSSFATSPRSMIPLPRSPTKSAKTVSLVLQSPSSPKAKLAQIFDLKKSPDITSQSLPPSGSSSKGSAPVLLTQKRAEERHRKESETLMAKKSPKKSSQKVNIRSESLSYSPIAELPQPVVDTTTSQQPQVQDESPGTAPKLNAKAEEFVPSPKKSFGCSERDLCSHEAPQRDHGPAGRHPEAFRHLRQGVSRPVCLRGDSKEYEVHVTPTGSFCTTTEGVLSKMPEVCMLQGLDQFSLNLPSAINLNSRLIGRPYMSHFGNSELLPPHNTQTCQDMPPPGSALAEQFLVAATKLNSVYNRREAARRNPNHEQPINFGFSQRAHFAQGASVCKSIARPMEMTPQHDSSCSELPETNNERFSANHLKHIKLHAEDSIQFRDAPVLPGLRGGGPANLRGELSTKNGIYNIKGIYPVTGTDITQMPTVVDYQGRLEVCFPSRHSTLRRVCNQKGKYVELYGGSELNMDHSENSWVEKEVYWCLYCGSDEHGAIHCPIRHIHQHTFCLHCRESGHVLTSCPHPPQFFPGRPISQSIELYVFTQNWKQQLLAWETKMGVRSRDFALSGGAGRHPFGLSGPCPDCSAIHHTAKTIEWVNTIIEDEKLGISFSRKCNWYVDTRYCPLYWILHHPLHESKRYTIYNPLGSIAVDALYRVYIHCQGWTTKIPKLIADEHIFKRVQVNGEFVLVEPNLPSLEDLAAAEA